MYRFRVGLLAGVSALAIAAAHPESVLAADVLSRPALVTKAPPATPRDKWTWWIEGGGSLIGGDPGVAGMTNFDVDPQQWGWEGAIGFEYRPAMSSWIWSAQFRYGANGSASASNNPLAVYNNPGALAFTPTVATAGTNTASRKEHYWVADFMVGRDLGVGQSHNTLRFGVRIAELHGKTNGSAHWGPFPVVSTCSTAPKTYCASETRIYEQKNDFLGAGPRLALDGQLPFGNGWAFEYGGGIAVLYGRRKVEQTVNVSLRPPTVATPDPICVTGCPVSASSSSNSFVFNADAMLGISYQITQNASLMMSYRFDGYWRALRGYDSNGNVTNLDRFYHGPMLRLTITN